jgi:hypothetical protein
MGKRLKLENTVEGKLAHKLWIMSFKSGRKKFDYKTFSGHRDYKFYMGFAEFCTKVNVLDPEKYMDWCIKEGIIRAKLVQSENTYARFVKHFIAHEEPIEAVERSRNFIKGISNNYFETVQPGSFLTSIEAGRISPWLYLLYWNSNAILKRMNEDHKNLLRKIIDPSVWSMRQRMNENVCNEIKKILKKEVL